MIITKSTMKRLGVVYLAAALAAAAAITPGATAWLSLPPQRQCYAPTRLLSSSSSPWLAMSSKSEQQLNDESTTHDALPPPPDVDQTERNQAVETFLQQCRQVGPIGARSASAQRQAEILHNAQSLTQYSDVEPARMAYTGLVFDLVYSDSTGASGGKMWGPIYGQVAQSLPTSKLYINSVKKGPLHVSLQAERAATSDTTATVSFLDAQVRLFGQTIFKKKINGGGTWDYLFAGRVPDQHGRYRWVRILQAPSLFVMEQNLEQYVRVRT